MQQSPVSFVLVVCALAGMASAQIHTEYATYDATTNPLPVSPGLPEGWADVKTPGDGRTYSVANIEVKTTLASDSPRFSIGRVGGAVLPEPVSPAPAPSQPFQITSGSVAATKQIVLLQCRGPSGVGGSNEDQDILWQVYWYGDSVLNGLAAGRHATNVRAISVWPVLVDGIPSPTETRIAICGETFDSRLPNNQFDGQSGWNKIAGPNAILTNFPRGLPSGYVAVYDGNGLHLWSHQFFFQDGAVPLNPDGGCAITDVSIRVEELPGIGMRDVVTYCGISSFGTRANESTSLSPLREFAAPTFGPHIAASGSANNGIGQWDGIVGRLSNAHSSLPVLGSATTRHFHSVVGGVQEDGLWGIAELSNNRFVVVGSTSLVNSAAPATSPVFPFTLTSVNWNSLTAYSVGIVAVFDATRAMAAVPLNDSLDLQYASSVGTASAEAHSHLSDVAVQLDAWGRVGATNRSNIVAVGTTDDRALHGSFMSGLFTVPTTLMPAGAATNGFAVSITDDFTGPMALFARCEYQGNPTRSSWCGVGCWNEFLDHFAICGRVAPAVTGQDIILDSIFFDNVTTLAGPLARVRSGSIASSANEQPVHMGLINSTSPGAVPGLRGCLAYSTENFLGQAAGGGIAVDERARVNVVGACDGAPYPVTGGVLSMPYVGPLDLDAVRSVVDMLPPGVGRSDGSGDQNHFMGPIPTPVAGTTGGTTPTCALLPLGLRSPDPCEATGTCTYLRRMLVDWEGPVPSPSPLGPPPSSIHALLVDRAPSGTQALATVVQFGVLTAPSAPGVAGLEDWVPFGIVQSLFLFVPTAADRSLRVPFILPPLSGFPGATFSAQVVPFLTTALGCTGQPIAATPAIVFSY